MKRREDKGTRGWSFKTTTRFGVEVVSPQWSKTISLVCRNLASEEAPDYDSISSPMPRMRSLFFYRTNFEQN